MLGHIVMQMRQVKNERAVIDIFLRLYMCGLLTKCEVKMAGYWWPSSFFACL